MSIEDIVAAMFEKRVTIGDPMSRINLTLDSLLCSNSEPNLETLGKRMGIK